MSDSLSSEVDISHQLAIHTIYTLPLLDIGALSFHIIVRCHCCNDSSCSIFLFVVPTSGGRWFALAVLCFFAESVSRSVNFGLRIHQSESVSHVRTYGVFVEKGLVDFKNTEGFISHHERYGTGTLGFAWVLLAGSIIQQLIGYSMFFTEFPYR